MQSKFRNLLSLYKEFRNEDAILIYQMGKVGSTSLEQSIPDSLHLHSLYGNAFGPSDVPPRSKLDKLKKGIFNIVRRYAINRRGVIKIITVIRDPYDRDVSQYFQVLQFWLSSHIINKRINDRFANKAMINDCFEQTYNFNYSREWFQQELFRFCGIDFAHVAAFKGRGMHVVNHGKFRILFLRADNINENIEAICAFIGKSIQLRLENYSDEKWYAQIYQNFKKTYEPSDSILECVYSSEWVTEFFTAGEIESMKISKNRKGSTIFDAVD